MVAALTALVLFLSDGRRLFTRPFWVDEWLAVFAILRRRFTLGASIVGSLAIGASRSEAWSTTPGSCFRGIG